MVVGTKVEVISAKVEAVVVVVGAKVDVDVVGANVEVVVGANVDVVIFLVVVVTTVFIEYLFP